MTDRELKMFEQNKKLVYFVYNKFYKNDLILNLYEDLIQEGFIALLNSIKNFDNTLNIKFSTYAIPAIKNKMLSYYKKELEYQMYNYELPETELNTDTANLTYIEYQKYNKILNYIQINDDYNFLYSDILDCLNKHYLDNKTEATKNFIKKLKFIIDLIIEGKTQVEIAEKLKISRQRVQQLYIKLKNICIKYGLTNYIAEK